MFQMIKVPHLPTETLWMCCGVNWHSYSTATEDSNTRPTLMGKHSDGSNAAVKIKWSCDSTQLYYLNMDKPTFINNTSNDGNNVGYSFRASKYILLGTNASKLHRTTGLTFNRTLNMLITCSLYIQLFTSSTILSYYHHRIGNAH